MKQVVIGAICCAMIGGPLWAKLPPPTEEQKAAAAAAKAKADEAAKKDAELLAKYQDLVAEKYKKAQGKTTAPAKPAVATKK
jgi:TRAP-type C4-dicarboxylate transport system substrate-binding protein